jgi:prepilin-type N-terminal cleavage/methylation domain-containing protein
MITMHRAQKYPYPPHQSPQQANNARGFTLVEVILAIAILAVMMTIVYRVLWGITQAKALIEDRRDGIYLANSVLNRLAGELQLAVKEPLLAPAPGAAGSSPASGIRPYLQGSSGADGDTITFSAKKAGQFAIDASGNSGRAPRVMITYSLAPDAVEAGPKDTGIGLYRVEVPDIQPLQEAYRRRLSFPIHTSLVHLQFRYYNKRTKSWTSEWDSPNTLPDIIEFTVALRTQQGFVQTYTSAVRVFD